MNLGLLGDPIASKPFVDIRSTQQIVAEEKAKLCLELSRLCRHVPASIMGGVEITRRWMATQKECLKVCAKKTSSRQELRTAINRMQGFNE